MPKTVLYASVGPNTTQYDIDVAACTLTPRGTVSSPANVQYVWPHANRKFLYIASTDSGSGMTGGGTNHHVTAYKIDPASGALSQHGTPIPLPTRPIHMATDIPSEHILVAFNNPPALNIYKINADGTPGAEVPQSPFDPGIFPHQVLATPDSKQVILVARGFDASDTKPEEPGALMVFDYADGVLSNQQKVAPDGGYGFGPRHLDFHPIRPWIYVSLERQNQVAFFTRTNGRLPQVAISRADTLSAELPQGDHQIVGTVHVHPNGRFVYVANRSRNHVGQNSIAVFALDQSGRPKRVQNVDTHGVHPRTFHVDPSGKMMVVAHIMGSGDIPCRLTTFRIADDGTLTFANAYDIDNGGKYQWWAGMVTLP